MNKILIVAQFFVSEDNGKIVFSGGTERYAYGLAKQLLSDGYDVRVISSTINKSETGWKVLDGLNVFLFKPPMRFYGYFIDFLSFVHTLKMVQKYKPDIIHIISVRYRFAAGAIVASKVMKKKTVCTITLTINKKLRFAFLLDYFIFSKIIGCSDSVISLSNEMKNEICKFLNKNKCKKVTIIPSFFIGSYYKKTEKYRNSILFVGRLETAQKGIDLLIKALYYVKNEIPDVKLHIVGEGISLNFLHDLVFDYGLKENVVFFGHINEDELINKFSNNEIFVLPSHREGLPMVLLEAMSSGLPIIAFDIDPVVEALDHGKYGILVKKGEVKDLSQAIIKLLRDNKLREYYSKMSLERSKMYSQSEVVRSIENLYFQML